MVKMYLYLGNYMPEWVKARFVGREIKSCKWRDNLYYTSSEFKWQEDLEFMFSKGAVLEECESGHFNVHGLEGRPYIPKEKFRLQAHLGGVTRGASYLLDIFFDPDESYEECKETLAEMEEYLKAGTQKKLKLETWSGEYLLQEPYGLPIALTKETN